MLSSSLLLYTQCFGRCPSGLHQVLLVELGNLHVIIGSLLVVIGNNKDEANSPKNLNNTNYQASSKKNLEK